MAKIIVPIMLSEEELEEYMYNTMLLENLERRMNDIHSRKVEINRKKRCEKMARKQLVVEVCDNGHYFVGNVNHRGAMNIAIIEKKINRKSRRRHYGVEDFFDDELALKKPYFWNEEVNR